ncbi:Cell division initiation protein DivIVA [Streptococcus sp. HSISS2]|nr:Cell division initiation protein DivIVA [Streptococcus sp. HSISS2]EQC74088.1 Cell division initiation protein DivIVA [Streptococcus sp. HSISS3]
MAITVLEIIEKQFTTKFRGYNQEEVDEFLDIIVDGYEELVHENRELAARVKELEEMVKNKGGL